MQIQSYQSEHKIEYSIVNINELEGALRIDAEYYDPLYIKINKKIINKKHDLFWSYVVSFGSGKNLTQSISGTPFIRTQNVRPILINKNGLSYTNEKIKLTKIGDLLFVRVGMGVGDSSVITPDFLNSAYSDNVLLIKVKETNPFYISVFFNSETGKIYFKHILKGSARPLISRENFQNLRIPIPSDHFQKQIENLVLSAYKERKKADTLYKEAEDILSDELGLKNWKPKTKKIKIDGEESEEEENISIRRLSECLKVNRFDAEYWLPKYDEFLVLLNNLKKKKGIELKNLSMLVDYKKGFEVGSMQYLEEGKIPFIRVSNLNEKEINLNSAKYISEKLYKKLKEQYEPNEEDILFTKDATIGISYLLDKPIKGIISSGILRLIVKKEKVNKEYLNLVLNSLACKLQINRSLSGAIIKHFKPTEVMNLLIPLINQQIQYKISQNIQQSFKARRKSKELLEIAKRGVEIYIENDEQKGINYITEQL
jgi:restriction endonuclease S subunit